jgi:hypothetical protein
MQVSLLGFDGLTANMHESRGAGQYQLLLCGVLTCLLLPASLQRLLLCCLCSAP